MALIATRLSRQAEAGFSAMPTHSTNVVPLKNGNEVRNADWAYPRRRYSSKYAQWTRAGREDLLAAVYAAQGQKNTFLFRDWSDFRVTDQSLGNAPSGTTPVQLVRTYTFGSITRTRPIKFPVASTVIVRQAGTPKAGTADPITGLFTPDSAWTAGQPLTADFEFDVQVRFASDEVAFVLPHRDVCEVECELVEVLE